jgi:hypothetical protein
MQSDRMTFLVERTVTRTKVGGRNKRWVTRVQKFAHHKY